MAIVVYRPAHQRQLVSSDPYGKYNCSAYSAAMAFDRHTLGGLIVTGKDVRALSNEPTPDSSSPGLNLKQLVDVSRRLRVPLNYRVGKSWETFLADIRACGAVIQIDYDQMGEYSSQPGFTEGHAMYVNNISGDGDLLVYDPLARGPREIPRDVIKRAMTKWAQANGLTGGGLYYATTRATPLVAK